MNPVTPTSPTFNAADPVLLAVEQRAADLKVSGLSPRGFGRKLQEEVVSLVGPDRAKAYYIGAESDGENVKFEVARLGPKFLARLIGDDQSAELKLSYQTTTAGGWQIGIAVSAAVPYQRPKGARLQGSFAVTISR